MRRIVLLSLFFLSPVFGLTDAQEMRHNPYRQLERSGALLLHRAKRLAEYDNNYQAALNCYEKAATIFLRENNWEKYIETLNGIGRVYNDLADYEQAEKYIKKAIDLSIKRLGKNHPGTAHSYAGLASLQTRSGALDSALYYNQKALNIYTQTSGLNSPEAGMIFIQFAFTYAKRFSFDKAIEYAQKGLIMRKITVGNNDPYVAFAYNIIGSAYGRKGNYENYLYYCHKGLEIALRLFSQNNRLKAVIYREIAYAYRLKGDYDKQLEYYKKSLNIYRGIFGEYHPNTADIYSNIGYTYMQKGDYAKQIDYYGKALAIYEQTKSEDLFYPYLDLAMAYLRLNERDKALACYKKACRSKGAGESKHPLLPFYEALVAYHKAENKPARQLASLNKAVKVLQKNGYEKYLIMAEVRSMQGEHFLRQSDPAKALRAFQQGLIAVSEEFNSPNIEDNPDSEKSGSRYLLLNLLTKKALALNRLGESSEKTAYSKTALNTYEAALRLIDRLRIGLETEEFKEKITNKFASVYEETVETAQRLYEQTKEEGYLERAFYASERNKAFLLHEATAESRAKVFAGIPQTLLKREKELKTAILYYESQLKEEKRVLNSKFIVEFENQITLLREKLETLIHTFEKEYPQYYALKYDTEPSSVEKLQSSLEKNTALAEYLVGERNLYVFLLSKNGLKLIKTEKPENLAERVQQLQHHVLSRNFEGYTQEAHRLCQEVFEPLRAHLGTSTRLTVVPDGPLWYLNFETLLSRPSQARDYAKQAYLLKDYSFGYAYSATLSYGNPKVFNQGPASKRQCLAFSFSGGGEDQKHEELPGSLTELRAVSKILKGQFLRGREANEAAFKQLAPNHTVLHLALHGEVDDRRPERSALYFPTVSDKNDKQKVSSEDGVLYASELYDMNLNAELAVLSACNTGDGRLVKGEGIVSLGRAFAYAGCKSLVMSLWEVSDATAPELMEHFYKNLKQGLPKDEALRKAKLAYLASADNLSANPFYWGGFVLLGDSAPLPLEKPQAPQRADFRSLWAAALLLCIGVTFLRLSRERKVLF